MMTWWLWRALIHGPGVSPLFRESYVHARSIRYEPEQHLPPEPLTWRERLRRVVMGLLAGVVLAMGGMGLFAVIACLLPFVLLFFGVTGLVYGGRCAYDTSTRLASAHRDGYYDLLCLTPPGSFSVNWSVCTTYLRRYQQFDLLRILLSGVSFSMAAGAIGISLFFSIGPLILPGIGLSSNGLGGMTTILQIASLLIGFYLNFVQSIVIGCLLGILIPMQTRAILDAQAYVLLAYLTILAGTLILAAFGWLALAAAFDLLGLTGSPVLPLLQLATFYLLREGVIRALWSRLIRELNVDRADTHDVLLAQSGWGYSALSRCVKGRHCDDF